MLGPTRLQRAGRSMSERLGLQWHACPVGRPSGTFLPNESYRLPRRCVQGERSGGVDRARTFPDLPANAGTLPEVQAACASQQTRDPRLHKGTEVGSEEYLLDKLSS